MPLTYPLIHPPLGGSPLLFHSLTMTRPCPVPLGRAGQEQAPRIPRKTTSRSIGVTPRPGLGSGPTLHVSPRPRVGNPRFPPVQPRLSQVLGAWRSGGSPWAVRHAFTRSHGVGADAGGPVQLVPAGGGEKKGGKGLGPGRADPCNKSRDGSRGPAAGGPRCREARCGGAEPGGAQPTPEWTLALSSHGPIPPWAIGGQPASERQEPRNKLLEAKAACCQD